MGSLKVTRTFRKKVVEFPLYTTDGHSYVRVEKSPVLKFKDRTETEEFIDFTDAKKLIIEYFTFNDHRYFVTLYLKSLFDEDNQVVWQNPMENTVDFILYKDFLRFEIGNHYNTFRLLNYFIRIFLICLLETEKDDSVCQDLVTKIIHIIANIILLPYPINDDAIFKEVRKFYELAEFLLKAGEACNHFPTVLPRFDDQQLEDFTKIGESFQKLLPKTSKFVEFDFTIIDSEALNIARKEITHKYWDIRTLFNDGGVSLKKLFFFQSFSILDLSIRYSFCWFNSGFKNTNNTIWLTFQFRINSMLVNRNSFDILPKIRNLEAVSLVTELINEIPSIIEQLDKLSNVPIKSSTANDISQKSDSTADNLKQQLFNWQIIHAIRNPSSGN